MHLNGSNVRGGNYATILPLGLPLPGLGVPIPGLFLRRRRPDRESVGGLACRHVTTVVPELPRRPGRLVLAELQLGEKPDRQRRHVQHVLSIGRYRRQQCLS